MKLLGFLFYVAYIALIATFGAGATYWWGLTMYNWLLKGL